MEKESAYGDDYHYIPATSVNSGIGMELKQDLYSYTIQIVNIHFVGDPATDEFILIDAGMPHSANKIIDVTEERFGKNSRPQAIVLTHGHFDHVGGLIELVERWEVPVYAHELEFPFLTGKESYPAPDPSVEGGMVAKMSALFPNEPIQISHALEKLPDNGEVPYLSDYRWIHTPGHSPGHVSLFRESDRTLIAGDAFVTVKQDALYKVMTQEKEMSGPPRYLTPDWTAAEASVKKLAELKPALAITGHGPPMEGKELSDNLDILVRDFQDIAIPDYGKYIQ